MLDVLEPGEEHRVERGRRDLGDAAAEVLLEDAVGDDVALGEAVVLGPLADGVVEAEGLARPQQGAVDQLGGAGQVDVAVLGVREVRGEGAHPLGHLERLGVRGGEGGLGRLAARASSRRSAPGVRRPRRTAPPAPRDRSRRRPWPGRHAACPWRTSIRASSGSRPTVRITGSSASSISSPSTRGSSSPSSASMERPSPNSRGGRDHPLAAEHQRHRRRHRRPAELGLERLVAPPRRRPRAASTSVGSFCEPPCRNRCSRISWVSSARDDDARLHRRPGPHDPSRKTTCPPPDGVSMPLLSSSRTACISDWSTATSAWWSPPPVITLPHPPRAEPGAAARLLDRGRGSRRPGPPAAGSTVTVRVRRRS